MVKYAGYKLALIAAFVLYGPALAQEQDVEEPADAAQVTGQPPAPEGGEGSDRAGANAAGDASEADDEADDEVIDDSDLDEQVYEEDDDDFIPSEEIPVDEAIPFPTNI